MSTLDEYLNGIDHDVDAGELWPLGEVKLLTAMLRKCRSQRDGWANAYMNDEYSHVDDDAELLALAGE
jgi:hypothetical protein